MSTNVVHILPGRFCHFLLIICLAFISIVPDSVTAQELEVLPPEIEKIPKGQLLRSYQIELCQKALDQRRETYESLKTTEKITDYQKRLREFFLKEIGGFPEKTPLNAKVLSVEERDGYRIEKVIYESRPKHYVTAHLYLPDTEPPHPGVLLACGHARPGKAYYQRIGIALALSGIASLCYDPISQGERGQLPINMGENRTGSTYGHMMATTGSILLGRNAAHFRIWDGIRSLDYLASRPEIDATKIGCSGNSGGGTLTSYLMALDDRIQAAAPSCYLTSFERLFETIGPQDAEQNIHGQTAFGMNHADYIIMRAPKPTLMCTATRDFFDINGSWDTFRQAKRIYTRLGFAERIDLVEADEQHGFSLHLRTGAVRWMRRWLLGVDDATTEPDIEVLPEKETWCLSDGEVMNLPGAKSIYDLNIDLERQLVKKRRQFWKATDRKEILNEIRRISGIRPLVELTDPDVKKVGSLQRKGYTIEKLILVPEHGVGLPALMFRPAKPGKDVVLYLHGKGKHIEAVTNGEILDLVNKGKSVLAIDMLAIGELAPLEGKPKWDMIDSEWRECFLAYHLGYSMLGMRTEDVLACARLVASGGFDGKLHPVHLVAIDKMGPPALHAAALESHLFASVRISRSLVSWSKIIHQKTNRRQFCNAVHGVLEVYDLPDLASTLPKNKLTIVEPMDAEYEPIR